MKSFAIILLQVAFCFGVRFRGNEIADLDLEQKAAECSSDVCKVSYAGKGSIHLFHGSALRLVHDVGSGVAYEKTYTVQHPYFNSSCFYEYVSQPYEVYEARVNWACLGTGTCKDEEEYLYHGLGRHYDDHKYVVANYDNPLHAAYCPRRSDCRSPFAHLNHGCATIDDGHAAGAVWVGPDQNTNLVGAVFKCTIHSIGFGLCEGDNCVEVRSDGPSKGPIKFNVAKPVVISEVFTVGVLFAPDLHQPSQLLYGVPEYGLAGPGDPFAFQQKYLSTGTTCLNGTYLPRADMSVRLTFDGKPGLSYSVSPSSFQYASKVYDPLYSHIQCNFRDSYLGSETVVNYRSYEIVDKQVSDSVDGVKFDLLLNPTNCDFGDVNYDLFLESEVSVSEVFGDVSTLSHTCTGCGNIFGGALLTVSGKSQGTYDYRDGFNTAGISRCSGVSQDPLSCNFTAGSPLITFSVNGKHFSVDCDLKYGCDIIDVGGDIIGDAGNNRFSDSNSFAFGMYGPWGIFLYVLIGFVGILAAISLCCCLCSSTRAITDKKSV